MRFMQDSLANLVSNLPPESFEILKTFFPKKEQWKLLLRKVVLPYDYFDGFDKLKETKLPPIEDFYSSLNEQSISEEDHQHAFKVWDVFEMKTIRNYHDTYVTSDTAQLADVFENFRKLCVRVFGLDPAHYFTAPGLFFDALFKHTGHRGSF